MAYLVLHTGGAAALRAELQLLKQSQLRKRAVQSGATDEDLDKADDEVRLLPFSTHKGRG